MHLGEEAVGPKKKLFPDIQSVPRENPLSQSLVEGVWIRRVHLEDVFMLLPSGHFPHPRAFALPWARTVTITHAQSRPVMPYATVMTCEMYHSP